MGNYIFLLLLSINIVFIGLLFYYILKRNDRSQIHIIFNFNIILMFIWTIGQLLEILTRIISGKTYIVFVYLYFTGVIFVPLTLLLTGLCSFHHIQFFEKKFNRNIIKLKWLLISMPQFFVFFLMITNDAHKLFLVKYSFYNNEVVFGRLFIVHAVIAYVYIGVGLFLLAANSIQNSGLLSKQSILIGIGIAIPMFVSIVSTSKIILLPSAATPICFSFGIGCFAIAIIKFKFLNIELHLHHIFDMIPVSIVVVTNNFTVAYCNKSFQNNFEFYIKKLRTNNLIDLSEYDLFKVIIDNISSSKYKNLKLLKSEGSCTYAIEINPLLVNGNTKGTVIFMRDIAKEREYALL